MEEASQRGLSSKEEEMKRTRLSRKRKVGIVHRLTDAEHNFFKAVHASGHSVEDFVSKKWNRLSWKRRHEILLGAQVGAAAGAVAATAGMGGLPMTASVTALGYSGAKGIRFSVNELSEKYGHWKKAHNLS